MNAGDTEHDGAAQERAEAVDFGQVASEQEEFSSTPPSSEGVKRRVEEAETSRGKRFEASVDTALEGRLSTMENRVEEMNGAIDAAFKKRVADMTPAIAADVTTAVGTALEKRVAEMSVAIAAEMSVAMDAALKKRDEEYNKRIEPLEAIARKAATRSISGLEMGDIEDMGYNVEMLHLQSTTPTDIPPLFEWGEASESAHATAYIAHIAKFFDEDSLIGVAPPIDDQFLDNQTLPLHIKGTTDVVIGPFGGSYQDVFGIVELKKNSEASIDQYLPQLFGEVISANLRYPRFKPFGVLTDLCDYWVICWVEGNLVRQVTHEVDDNGHAKRLSRGTAVDFLRNSAYAAGRKLGAKLYGAVYWKKVSRRKLPLLPAEFSKRQSPARGAVQGGAQHVSWQELVEVEKAANARRQTGSKTR